MSKINNRRVERAKMSTAPMIYWDKKTIENIKRMALMPERADRVRLLFLLDASNFLRERIIDKAPSMEIGGKEINYAKKMMIGILEEQKEFDSVAMWLDGIERKVTEKNVSTLALYFRLVDTSPDWIKTMVANNPWPATLVPVIIGKKDAKIISRNIRDDEREYLEENILSRSRLIEKELDANGLNNAKISRGKNGVGTSAHDDIGYNVLRKETGFDGSKQQSHWRPAFMDLKKYIPILMKKVNGYMMSGNESLFNIPTQIKDIDMESFKRGEGFMKEIKALSPLT